MSKVKSNLGKCAAGFLFGLSLMGLAGCATTGSYAVENNNLGYEEFFSLRGDQRLVRKNNDVYLEKEDGTESKRVTYTPNIKENYAAFSTDGKYIMYNEMFPTQADYRYKYYKVNSDCNQNTKKEISGSEFDEQLRKN